MIPLISLHPPSGFQLGGSLRRLILLFSLLFACTLKALNRELLSFLLKDKMVLPPSYSPHLHNLKSRAADIWLACQVGFRCMQTYPLTLVQRSWHWDVSCFVGCSSLGSSLHSAGSWLLRWGFCLFLLPMAAGASLPRAGPLRLTWIFLSFSRSRVAPSMTTVWSATRSIWPPCCAPQGWGLLTALDASAAMAAAFTSSPVASQPQVRDSDMHRSGLIIVSWTVSVEFQNLCLTLEITRVSSEFSFGGDWDECFVREVLVFGT